MSTRKRVGVAHFLSRTFEMLETQKLKHLIEWSPCGEYFYIKNSREFANKVLPQYFRHRNFQSFLRQLNMYNFVKRRLKNGWNSFQHKYFKRDAKYLLSKVHRRNNGDNTDIDEENSENEVELTQFKEELLQSQQLVSQLLMQQQIIREQFMLLKTKLLYQLVEEKKQDQFLGVVLTEFQPQAVELDTLMTANHKQQPMSPTIFVL